MKQLYTILLTLCACLFFGSGTFAQTSVQATATSAESRCRSTGSITVTATGGSGSFNYKAVGPITTPFTSSNIITGLEAGTYNVVVKDVIKNTEYQVPGVVVTGSYSDPRFVLNATDVSCAGNDGAINVSSQQFGRAPFTYTIVSPSPAAVGTANTSGSFSGLVPGEYSIRLTDSCGGIQVRTVQVLAYNWWFESAPLTRVGCDQADIAISLKDNKGNSNLSGTAFSAFRYGIVQSAGDTLWNTSRSFRFTLGKRRAVTVVAKDACGRLVTYTAAIDPSIIPALGASINISNKGCATFTAASANPVNLTSPQYCVFNSSNVQVACNTTGLFNNLPYGSYTMQVRDACYDTTIVRTFSVTAPVPSVAASVSTGNFTCTSFDALVTGQTNLTSPQYCLYTSTNTLVRCNTTGSFTNIAYGSYNITITDGCNGATITRTVNASKPVPAINSVTISSMVCGGFEVRPNSTANLQSNPQYCVYDVNGNLVACNNTGIFTNLPYGSYCMKAITACGDMTAPRCFSQAAPTPTASATVNVSNRACSTYTATITGQTHLTNPQYCIYNSSNVQLSCNNNGVFNNLAYGTYSIVITDGCNGATITRTVTASAPVPALATTVDVSNMACATFTATINGTNLTAPVYSVYNASNTLVATGSSNVFNNLPYGAYCFKAKDGCTGGELSTCQTISNPLAMTITATKTCTLNVTNLQVVFQGSGSPYKVQVFHQDGTLVREVTSASATVVLNDIPALPAGGSYRVVGTNNCGQTSEKTIVPNASVISRSAAVQLKCPSARAQFGSGDLTVISSSNYAAVIPSIIAKDGSPVSINYSSNTASTYLFAALEPGTYTVQYSVQGCSSKEIEDVTVLPYTYPKQDRSAIYQCSNSGFSVGASVTGGVGPYKYEIIGSMPQSPSIVAAPQNSPLFAINNGTTYSLVRLRSVDACGNATLNDVSVLPLQNIAVTASQTCMYQTIKLSVDTIPNATYQWYLKQSPNDSTLIGTDIGYTIPFLIPEKTGIYVCRMSVNNGCVTQVSSFNVTGRCDDELLPVKVNLKATRGGGAVQLQWQAQEEQQVVRYVLESKAPDALYFTRVDSVVSRRSTNVQEYHYPDKRPQTGLVQYRLRLIGAHNSLKFSNVVQVAMPPQVLKVQPNPAKSFLRITWKDQLMDEHQLELYNAVGQLVHTQKVLQNGEKEFVFQRPGFITPGMYVLRISNRTQQETQLFKILFE